MFIFPMVHHFRMVLRRVIFRSAIQSPGRVKDTPSCAHSCSRSANTNLCACRNFVRPSTAVIQTKNYTATLLRKTLSLYADDIDIIAGYTNGFYTALVSRSQQPGITIQNNGQHFWRFLLDENVVPWRSQAGRVLQQTCPLNVANIFRLDYDPIRTLTVPSNDGWTDVDIGNVDLRKGTVTTTTILGRAFICFAFIPALMHNLNLGGQWELFSRLWATAEESDHERITAYFIYHVINKGFGKFNPRKKKIWNEYVAGRRLAAMEALIASHSLELDALKTATATRQDVIAQAPVDHTATDWQVTRLMGELEMLKVTVAENAIKTDTPLVGIGETVGGLKADVSAIGTGLDTLGAKVAGLGNAVGTNNRKVDKGLETLGTNVADCGNAVGTITKKVDNELEAVDAKVGRQGVLFGFRCDEQRTEQRSIALSITNLTAIAQENRITLPGAALAAVSKRPPQPLIYFRIRNSPPGMLEDIIPDSAVYRRIFVSNEPNKIVSRAVTTALSKPFLVELMGYSDAGKTFTVFGPDGLFSMIVERLPPVSITVYEVLNASKVLGIYDTTKETVPELINAIMTARATEVTQANEQSSRTHLAILFNDLESNTLYGILLDVAWCEESEKMCNLGSEMLANDNMYLRKMLEELVLKGHAGFVTRKTVTVYKWSSHLNREVSTFLRDIESTPAIQVLLCATEDGGLLFNTEWKDAAMCDIAEDVE